MSDKTILCVEDNEQVQTANKALLEARGYKVMLAMTVAEAWEAFKRETPALIVLDIRLPDGNGLDFLRELRKTSAVPIIALTSNNTEKDVITGLEGGCDDYVTKPYIFSVLYARIEALLRRAGRVPEMIVKGPLTLNPIARQALLNGEDLFLTQNDFALLLMLIQNSDKVMSAEYIYEKVWGQSMAGDKNAVQAAVSRLRKKIELSGYDIAAQRGKGYVFEHS